MNSFVGAFHDAVILYALALNETLAAGMDPKDGMQITLRMWNRTFEGQVIYKPIRLYGLISSLVSSNTEFDDTDQISRNVICIL